MSDVTVEIRDNGPIIIRGGVTITDASGNTYEMKDTVFFCRCGQSTKKPFCDGTHKTCGFESAPRAAEAV